MVRKLINGWFLNQQLLHRNQRSHKDAFNSNRKIVFPLYIIAVIMSRFLIEYYFNKNSPSSECIAFYCTGPFRPNAIKSLYLKK